jgi:hypothetical protein
LEFFPNKKLDNWQRLKTTMEFIEVVENALKSDPSYVRDHSETKAIYTIKGNFKNGQNQGTYAHELVALEF